MYQYFVASYASLLSLEKRINMKPADLTQSSRSWSGACYRCWFINRHTRMML